ncbi:MAG TPA: hypothetical protein VGD94_13110 [Vicinamibacterales bacterium]
MPDVGMQSRSVRAPSHTSSEQWQSFEIKMRHRRAERCVARAEAAFESGHDEEAREALAEARALNAQSPDFDTLRARVDERLEAVAAAARRTRTLKVSGAVIAVLLIVASAGVFLALGRAANPDPAATRVEEPASLPVSAPIPAPTTGMETPENQGVAPAQTEIVPPEPQAALPPRQDEVRTPPAEDRSRSSSPAANGPPLPPVRQVEPDVQVPRMTTGDAAGSLLPPSSTAVDPVASGLPSTAAPKPLAPPPLPVVEPERGPPAISEEQRVRAVLAEFEAAYSSLDAAAARAVWPSVDERSLASAFASLRSQRVSLGTCAVGITGAAARADCNGVTAWTPKIGGGERREQRRWTFELQSANGVWRIVRAQAR